MKISCVIPNYNGGDKLVKCLKLCLEYAEEVIIIDDKSTDDSLKKVKKVKSKKVKIFQNKKNKGSSYTRNFGAKKAKYKKILFIDSDCYFNKKNFMKLIHKKGDILYPKIINKDKSIYNYIKNHKYLQNSVCFLIDTKKFKKINGFDQNIPIYMDDVEFFFRCYKANYNCVYVPGSEGFHDAEISTRAISQSFFNNLKNTVYFCLKHKRGFGMNEFPTWITIIANMRRMFLNKDRLYGLKITKSRTKTIKKGIKSIFDGFKLYFSKNKSDNFKKLTIF